MMELMLKNKCMWAKQTFLWAVRTFLWAKQASSSKELEFLGARRALKFWFLIFHRNKFHRFFIWKCLEDFLKTQFKFFEKFLNLRNLWNLFLLNIRISNQKVIFSNCEIFTKLWDSHNNSLIKIYSHLFLFTSSSFICWMTSIATLRLACNSWYW